MDPTPFFIMGMLTGIVGLLLIQLYGRIRVRRAVSAPDLQARRTIELLDRENDTRAGQIDRLHERLAVLERLTVDPGVRTAREIDALRN